MGRGGCGDLGLELGVPAGGKAAEKVEYGSLDAAGAFGRRRVGETGRVHGLLEDLGLYLAAHHGDHGVEEVDALLEADHLLHQNAEFVEVALEVGPGGLILSGDPDGDNIVDVPRRCDE